jgi:hypothetical protein
MPAHRSTVRLLPGLMRNGKGHGLRPVTKKRAGLKPGRYNCYGWEQRQECLCYQKAEAAGLKPGATWPKNENASLWRGAVLNGNIIPRK